MAAEPYVPSIRDFLRWRAGVSGGLLGAEPQQGDPMTENTTASVERFGGALVVANDDRPRASVLSRCRAQVRRRAAVWLAAAALGVAATTGFAAPAGAAERVEQGSGANVFRIAFSGYVLEAGWSTCPVDLAAVPVGTSCRTTDVMAFLAADQEQAVPDYSLRHPKGPTVKVWEGECEVVVLDGELGCAITAERFGRTEVAQVWVDPRLDSGGARAVVPVQTWSSDGDSGEGKLTVSVDWVGTSARTALAEVAHSTSRWVTHHSSTRGWQRDCTATGTVDDAPVAGDAAWCSMLRVRQAEISVYRGFGASGPPPRGL